MYCMQKPKSTCYINKVFSTTAASYFALSGMNSHSKENIFDHIRAAEGRLRQKNESRLQKTRSKGRSFALPVSMTTRNTAEKR